MSALGMDSQSMCQGLRHGLNGVGPIDAFDCREFRSQYGGQIRDEIPAPALAAGFRRPLDRATRMVLCAAEEALEMAGLSEGTTSFDRTAIVLGTCSGGFLSGYRYYRERSRRRRGRASLLLELPMQASAAALAHAIGSRGGIHVVSNACASGAIAIARARELLLSGRVDRVIAGGFDALTPLNAGGFGAMRNSSKLNRIRPFDLRRDGLLLGEAAAVLILDREDEVDASPHLASVVGTGISSDTYHITAPDPTGSGAARAIELALEDAGVSPEEIDYFNAHGTGTRHNDRTETNAIKRVFGDHARTLPVSSTKSQIGHTLGAAGAIEVVASILAMRAGFLPPTINYEVPDPKCDLDCVPNLARDATIRRFVSNSLGFGGTNCSIVVESSGIVSR